MQRQGDSPLGFQTPNSAFLVGLVSVIQVQWMGGSCQIPKIIEKVVFSLLKKNFSLTIVKKNAHPSMAKTVARMAITMGSIADDIVLIIHHN